jgi:hypothetical protein
MLIIPFGGQSTIFVGGDLRVPPRGRTHRCAPTFSRSQVALGNVATKRLSLIIIFIERDNARPVGVPGRTGLRRVAGVEAVAGAFLAALIPEIATLPDAMAQAGDGADEGGVVSQHILRKWRAVPAHYGPYDIIQNRKLIVSYPLWIYYDEHKESEYFLKQVMIHL